MQIILPIIIVIMAVAVAILWKRQAKGGSSRGRFVTEQAYRANLSKQVTMSPQTVAQLRKYNVTENTKLRLEFFLYTDTEAKAQSLSVPLRKLGYELSIKRAANDRKRFLVTGWTIPLKMDEDTVVGWTRQMCQLGYEHDCNFDGWGTNPD